MRHERSNGAFKICVVDDHGVSVPRGEVVRCPLEARGNVAAGFATAFDKTARAQLRWRVDQHDVDARVPLAQTSDRRPRRIEHNRIAGADVRIDLDAYAVGKTVRPPGDGKVTGPFRSFEGRWRTRNELFGGVRGSANHTTRKVSGRIVRQACANGAEDRILSCTAWPHDENQRAWPNRLSQIRQRAGPGGRLRGPSAFRGRQLRE